MFAGVYGVFAFYACKNHRETLQWGNFIMIQGFFPAISMEKSSMNHKETPCLQVFPCKKYCISLCTEIFYNVYQCSLQRLWGLPAIFTIFPVKSLGKPRVTRGTPQNFCNVYRVFSRNIYAKKQYKSQGNPILMGFLFNSYCFFPQILREKTL